MTTDELLERWRRRGRVVVRARGVQARLRVVQALLVPVAVLVIGVVAAAYGDGGARAIFVAAFAAVVLLVIFHWRVVRPGGYTCLVVERAGVVVRPGGQRDIRLAWPEIREVAAATPTGHPGDIVLLRLGEPTYARLKSESGRYLWLQLTTGTEPGTGKGRPWARRPPVDPPWIALSPELSPAPEVARVLERARQESGGR